MGNDSSNGYGDEMGLPDRLEAPGTAKDRKSDIYSMTDYDQMRSALAEALDIEDTGQPWTLLVEEVWAMRQRAAALAAKVEYLEGTTLAHPTHRERGDQVSKYEVVREWLDQGGPVSHGGKFTSPKVYRELDLSLQREAALRSRVGEQAINEGHTNAVGEIHAQRTTLRVQVERYGAALRKIAQPYKDDPPGGGQRASLARAALALATDTPGPIWMPICRQCANGPLTGESITSGLCDECAPDEPPTCWICRKPITDGSKTADARDGEMRPAHGWCNPLTADAPPEPVGTARDYANPFMSVWAEDAADTPPGDIAPFINTAADDQIAVLRRQVEQYVLALRRWHERCKRRDSELAALRSRVEELTVVERAARDFADRFNIVWAGSVDPSLTLDTPASQAFLTLLQALTADTDPHHPDYDRVVALLAADTPPGNRHCATPRCPGPPGDRCPTCDSRSPSQYGLGWEPEADGSYACTNPWHTQPTESGEER